LRPHADLAAHAEERGHGGGRHPVLAGARLGDQPALLQPACNQRLSDRVVDLVGAGVEQVLALEEDAGTAEPPREAAGEVEPGRPSGVLAEPARELALEGGVAGQARVGPLELEELRHEGFGDVPAPVLAEVPVLVRQPWPGAGPPRPPNDPPSRGPPRRPGRRRRRTAAGAPPCPRPSRAGARPPRRAARAARRRGRWRARAAPPSPRAARRRGGRAG